MAPMLELNLKAKKTIPAEQPITPNGPAEYVLVLKEGKSYVTACGVIVGPLQKGAPGRHLAFDGLFWNETLKAPPPTLCWTYNTKGGGFTGFPKDDPRRILFEWHEGWEFHLAWVLGKTIQFKTSLNEWYGLDSYSIISTTFGKDSHTTHMWWMINYHQLYKTGNLRVAP